MNTLPSDIYNDELWKHLSYDSLISLCKSNTAFSKICKSNAVWQYLLDRDFAIIHNGTDAKEMYLLYRKALYHFTQFFPIITHQALKFIVEYLDVSMWSAVENAIHVYRHMYGDYNREKIMTISTLSSIIHAEEENDPAHPRGYHAMSDVFRDMIHKYEHDNEDDWVKFYAAIDYFRKYGCLDFKQYIIDHSEPILVFVNTKLVVLEFDYELAQRISYELYEECEVEFQKLKNNVLSLL